MSSGRLHEVKNNGKSLTVRLQKCSRSLVRCSFTRGSNRNALTGKILVFWIRGRFNMGGGRTWRFNFISLSFFIIKT